MQAPALAAPNSTCYGIALENAHFQSRRVLVIDDSRDGADSFAQVLNMHGLDARPLYDAGDAVDAALSFRPAVVFLDLLMPSVDGFTAAREIRAQPQLAGLWLVALTGMLSPSGLREVAAAGFDAYYLKPMEPAVLTELLEKTTRDRVPGRLILGPGINEAVARAGVPPQSEG